MKEHYKQRGVDIYEFKYRMDDPQIGRFWQIDPLAEEYIYNSTYAFSEDKVVAHVELEGLESAFASWVFMHQYQKPPQANGNTTSVNNGASTSTSIGKPLTVTTHTSCHGTALPGWASGKGSSDGRDRSIASLLFGWLEGNGGGYVFTAGNGGNEETREGYNASGMRDITKLIELFLHNNSNVKFFARNVGKSLTSKEMEEITKFVKGIDGLESRMEDFKGSAETNQKPADIFIDDTVQIEQWDYYYHKNGGVEDATHSPGKAEDRKIGSAGTPDTVYRHYFKNPPPPKKDIPKKL